VLQCVAVCCSVLQCVAVCCSVYAIPFMEKIRIEIFASPDLSRFSLVKVSDGVSRLNLFRIWGLP